MDCVELALFGFLATLGVIFVFEKAIVKWYRTARAAYKLFHSIPADDGTSEYTIVPGKWCGRIPYRYQGESRVFYITNSENESVSANIARLYGVDEHNKRVNITPPPGCCMNVITPHEIGFKSVIIQVGENVSQYNTTETFTFPPTEDVVLYD